LLVIDGNWYLHRCFFTLKTSRPIEDVLPMNFVGLVCKDAAAVKATHLLIAFDGPNVFRYKLYPEYKANRGGGKNDSEEEGGKDIYQYLPHVRKLVEELGWVFKQNSKHEADDIGASAAAQYTLPTVIGTADKDSYQLLSARVRLYNSTTKPPIFIDEKRAVKRKGVAINQMVMFQTLIGDSTDNIPELMSPGKAKKMIQQYGSFKKWYAKGTAEDKRWLNVNTVALRLNRKLVELVTDLALPDIEELKVPKKTRQGMTRAWYEYQDFLYPKTKGLFNKR